MNMIGIKIYPRSNKIFIEADHNEMFDNVFFGMIDTENMHEEEMMQCFSMPLDKFMDNVKDTVIEMIRDGMNNAGASSTITEEPLP